MTGAPNRFQLAGSGTSVGGGFAARGSDVTINTLDPANNGGIDNTFFATRNFTIGSGAKLDGNQYANAALIIAGEIAFANGAQRIINVEGVNITDTGTPLVMGNVVNEITAKITGGDGSNAIALRGSGASGGGTIRISGGSPKNQSPGRNG